MPLDGSMILVGDVMDRLGEMADGSVQCCVTSPPYWGLRDYGVEGQMGLERTPEEYVEKMVAVFREVRRVLRGDAVCFLNVGDNYATGSAPGLKPKDLCLIPERLAIALQADGWYVRSRIAWIKPNPMPESVRDRPTSAWEHIWLLTKSARYFYDAEAVRTKAKSVTTKMPDGWDTGKGAHGSIHRNGREKGKQRGHGRRHAGFNDRWDAMEKAGQVSGGANLRNWWEVATQPYSDAHYAVFPSEIPRRCIKAGTSAKGACSECGAPWERVVERDGGTWEQRKADGHAMRYGTSAIDERDGVHLGNSQATTTGWRSICDHDAEVVPCTVLDPFAGSGTVGVVCKELDRRFIGIELNPVYAQMAEKRIANAGDPQIGMAL